MDSIIVAFLAGISLAYLVYMIISFHKRLKELESRTIRRHTHNTLNGLGDVQALLVHQVLQGEMDRQITLATIKRALQMLGQISESPYSYQDGPSQRETISRQAVTEFMDELQELYREPSADQGT